MYIQNKYTNWYYNIVNKAQSENRKKKQGIYYESHHIIPESFGGTEEVLLTAKEHFICHLLLCRMTTGNNKHKMINALIRMSFSKSKGQKRYTSKSFSLVRKFIAEKNSEMFKGKPKSEETKRRMKGVNGKWKRTKEYCKKLSDSRKGTCNGEKNNFFGKKHSEETKQAWSLKRKGKYPTWTGAGMKCYNNGIFNKMFFENEVDNNLWKKGKLKIVT